MGIHYFYTWLTSRYPMVKQPFATDTAPQVDHLYLDLNGVLHRCSKDSSALFKDLLCGKKLEEIFVSIINYTNYVINIIKPRKTLFIAIDGVAPRAKMNNQRNRRFMTSKRQRTFDEFLINTLKITPGAVSFKNNSISPGTEFMIELNRHIHFFIQRKIHEDENWRHIKVIFSGGNVPGEGEHKILNYIRQSRIDRTFDVADAHCIYGNDSDLVLLSLLTHLPHIVILREEFVFSKKLVINSATHRHHDEQRMELIYINILREYFEMEFKPAGFQDEDYLERIIDDFVLFTYFIGNDFLHQVYCMNTKMGIFDEFIETFINFYSSTGRYLVNKEQIDWEAFYALLQKLLPFQGKMIKTTIREFERRIVELEQNHFYAKMKKEAKKKQREEEEKFKKTIESNKIVDNEAPVPQEKLLEELMKFRELTLSETNDANKEVQDSKPTNPEVNKIAETESKSTATGKTESDPLNNKFDSILNDLALIAPQSMANNAKEDLQNAVMASKLEEPDVNGEALSDESSEENRPLPTNIKEINEEELEEENEESEIEQVLADEQTLEQLDDEAAKRYIQEFKDQYEKLIKAKEIMQKIWTLFTKGQSYRSLYYREYFGITEGLDVEINKICHNYLNGIDFVYKYYFSGCPSWDWYYRYKLSPLLSDLCDYMRRAYENGKKIHFDYPHSQPCPPYTQLLYILPKESLQLLPEKLAASAIAKGSQIAEYFPDDYELKPFDKHKDYTWLPILEHVCDEKMKSFISNFDWENLLNEEDKRRNSRGQTLIYYHDEHTEIILNPSVSGFDSTKANIKILPFHLPDEFPDIHRVLDYNETTRLNGKASVFPSFKNIPHLLFEKRKAKDRYICEIYITLKSVKEIYEQFRKTISEPPPKVFSGYRTALCDPIFQRSYRFKDVRWLDQKNNLFNSFFKNTEDALAARGILIKDPNSIIREMNSIPFVLINEPTFSFINFSKPPSRAPVVQIKCEESQTYPIAFFAAFWGTPHPKLRQYSEGEFKQSVDMRKMVLDLTNGGLLRVERPIGNESTHKLSVIRHQLDTNRLVIQNHTNGLTLIDEKFIASLGLELKQLRVLWLVLDSIKIFCDQKSHSTLVLGDAFDVGLNFINFINKDVESWRMVSDMIKIQLRPPAVQGKPNKTAQNRCAFIYSSGPNRSDKLHDVYLTKLGSEAVYEYFDDNKVIIDYLKSNWDKLITINKARRVPWYRCHFDAPAIFKDSQESDINIVLFRLYSNLMKKRHSSLLLQPSLSLNYPLEVVYDKLIPAENITIEKEYKPQDPLVMLGYAPYYDTIWPPLAQKPYYHDLGDRVVVVNSMHSHIKFGMSGIIIGVYKEIIEVLFDEPFIGATSLHGRCPNFRGYILHFFDVFNLSKWSNLLIKSIDHPNKKEKIWEGDYDLNDLIKLIRQRQKNF